MQQIEDYGLVRENLRALEVEERREQRLKLCLGSEVMKKHPVNIPFGTKAYLEGLGVPRFQKPLIPLPKTFVKNTWEEGDSEYAAETFDDVSFTEDGVPWSMEAADVLRVGAKGFGKGRIPKGVYLRKGGKYSNRPKPVFKGPSKNFQGVNCRICNGEHEEEECAGEGYRIAEEEEFHEYVDWCAEAGYSCNTSKAKKEEKVRVKVKDH